MVNDENFKFAEEFDTNGLSFDEVEMVNAIYDQLLFLQKKMNGVMMPQSKEDQYAFMLKNMSDEVQNLIDAYVKDENNAERVSFYNLGDQS
jgi:hypothetical protein|tara:strand:- start:171 stop:443 length:273 start_codon:yes stop_codon:yes gene_type:complete